MFKNVIIQLLSIFYMWAMMKASYTRNMLAIRLNRLETLNNVWIQFKQWLLPINVQLIWVSGRRCDFKCDGSSGVPHQLSPISFCEAETCWLEDLTEASWKDFWQTTKANVTPRLECSVIRGCKKAFFLVFMKVSPQKEPLIASGSLLYCDCCAVKLLWAW